MTQTVVKCWATITVDELTFQPSALRRGRTEGNWIANSTLTSTKRHRVCVSFFLSPKLVSRTLLWSIGLDFNLAPNSAQSRERPGFTSLILSLCLTFYLELETPCVYFRLVPTIHFKSEAHTPVFSVWFSFRALANIVLWRSSCLLTSALLSSVHISALVLSCLFNPECYV